MGIAAEKIADGRVKHLEMLQAIISRMSGQGASAKNYCITLVTAICGFALSLKSPISACLAIFPIVMLWSLDAQYLRLERRYRALFDKVRSEAWDCPPTFKLELSDAPPGCFWAAAFSWSLLAFYPALAAGVVLLMLAMRWTSA